VDRQQLANGGMLLISQSPSDFLLSPKWQQHHRMCHGTWFFYSSAGFKKGLAISSQPSVGEMKLTCIMA